MFLQFRIKRKLNSFILNIFRNEKLYLELKQFTDCFSPNFEDYNFKQRKRKTTSQMTSQKISMDRIQKIEFVKLFQKFCKITLANFEFRLIKSVRSFPMFKYFSFKFLSSSNGFWRHFGAKFKFKVKFKISKMIYVSQKL